MSALPPEYGWLRMIGPLPLMVEEALELFGTIEGAGDHDNPVILGWAKELGLFSSYSHDAIPWCGLFMAIVAQRAGKARPKNPLWARNWAEFGMRSEKPSLGDVLVFSREGLGGHSGGGHVGLYVGHDDEGYFVLGGNQKDRVCIVWIARKRLIAQRRPFYRQRPASARPFPIGLGGKIISENEA